MNAEVLAAVQLALSGQSETARERLGQLWEALPREDFFHRCVLAHYMADLQSEPSAELGWDQLALAAALAGSSDSFDNQIPDVTRASFLPSLQLNLASSYERTGALDLARQHAVLARSSTKSLPPTPLGQTTHLAILRICDRLNVPPCELARIQLTDHAEQVVLGNLLELYVHDLSESFPFVELGSDGRFGYPELASYWSEPASRFAFLIKESGKVAGFALVTVGSPAAAEAGVYDLAEFFVLRGYRRSGVGRRAALFLWRHFAGPWTVRCSESSPSALAFWSAVVAEFTKGDAKISSWPGKMSQFRVFRFDTARA